MADESGVSSAGEIETALEAMMSEIEQFSNVLEPHNAGPTMPDEPQEPEDILHMQEPQSADSVPMELAEPDAGQPSRHRDVVRHMDKPAPWGSFSFNRKLPKSAPPFGGFEAVCKFHALNSRTGCKKFVRFEGESLEDEQACLNKLRHWCNQARRFDRQRQHVRMPLRPQDVPSVEVVEAHKLVDDPPSSVRTDQELDGHVAKSAAKPVPKKKRAPKPKPKAKAAADGSDSGDAKL